jgi:hypothetical protein
MIIDLREIPVVWINLDSATKNAEIMNNRLSKHNFKNNYRKSGVIIPPPPNTPTSIAHYMGCGQSHIDVLENKDYSTPLLVLEDDVEFIENFNPIIEIPDDADGIYLGISHGNRNYLTQKINDNYYRIGGILAAHAILYLNDKYRKSMADIGRYCLYKINQPWDIGTSSLQFDFKVYAPIQPMIFQSNDRENANKWQCLTDSPLEDKQFQFQ